MVKKIAITGPESTGKSTLSAALAEALGTIWVPEFAREYLETLGRPYEESDLLRIAKGQIELQEELEARSNKYLICDTELLVMKIWSEHKYGRCHPWILQKLQEINYDLYILPYIDVPWEEDPLREHPDLREHFYKKYRAELLLRNANFIEVRGSLENRLQQAIIAVKALTS